MSKNNRVAEATTDNQFDFISNVTAEDTAESRKLAHTGRLIDEAKILANNVMMEIAKAEAEQKTQYIDCIDGGNAVDLMNLVNLTVGEDTIKAKSAFLSDCSDDEFSKLLESRRSDRSKKFKAGPRSSVTACQTYIATMIAEMMVRQAWNKPYAQNNNTGADVDVNDLEAVGKKIKSLQSKKCRLSKLATYDESVKAELEKTIEEIDRLNAFRPTVTKVASIKSVPAETVREALAKLDVSNLDADLVEQLKVAGLI